MPKPKPGSAEWRRQHGISDVVFKERGYIPYPAGEFESIREAFGAADCSPDQITWAENKAKLSDGLIMPAHALPLPELGLRPIPPQLRPDDPIKRDPVLHYHPEELPPSGTVVSFVDPETKKRKSVSEEHWSTAWTMRRHIVGHEEHGKALAAQFGYTTPRELHRLCTDRSCRENLLRVLAEANNPEPHQHEDEAKYVLTVKRRKTLAHDHADYVRDYWRARHIAKHHDGVDVAGCHVHDSTQFKKVTYWDDDKRMSPGRRIDALPLAWGRLFTADIVYFVMEGKIKADAALSAILERVRSRA